MKALFDILDRESVIIYGAIVASYYIALYSSWF